MIITYSTKDGTVLDNSGVADWLESLPDEAADVIERVAYANVDPGPDIAWVRVTDPDLQQQLLTHQHTVSNGEVQVGDPHPVPEPAEAEPDPDDDLDAALAEVEQVDDLEAKVDMLIAILRGQKADVRVAGRRVTPAANEG